MLYDDECDGVMAAIYICTWRIDFNAVFTFGAVHPENEDD